MSNLTAHLNHPRPLLVRPDWQDLRGDWGFATDDEDLGRARGWHQDAAPFTRTIAVPYPPESELSGIHDPAPHPIVWYRRSVRLDSRPGQGERLLLHFGAVDYRAEVWLNGVHIGGHEGGHTPFSFDVTDALVDGDEQLIVVRAEDECDDATQPRGKQDWRAEPHAVWYHRTTGIWQPVWAEVVPSSHIRRLHWTPDVAGAAVTLDVELSARPKRPLDVHVVLSLDDEPLAAQTCRTDRKDGRGRSRSRARDTNSTRLGCCGRRSRRLCWTRGSSCGATVC